MQLRQVFRDCHTFGIHPGPGTDSISRIDGAFTAGRKIGVPCSGPGACSARKPLTMRIGTGQSTKICAITRTRTRDKKTESTRAVNEKTAKQQRRAECTMKKPSHHLPPTINAPQAATIRPKSHIITIFTLPRGARERYSMRQPTRGIPVTVELWIALFATLAIGATVGFVFAKRNAPKKSELDALRDQLHAARTETAEIREGVSGHFEQSAVLFGRLAQDYRAFIEHFSESAQTLGISEIHAREMLEQASAPLISHDAADADAIEGAAVSSSSGAGEATTDAESTAAADSVEAEPESAFAASVASEVLPIGNAATADSDEPLELSADTAAASTRVSVEGTESMTEEVVDIKDSTESSVAEVDLAPPAPDEIAERKAG